MGSGRGGPGGGAFFHLFDWNRKSRKKLFCNGNVCSEKAIKGNKSDDKIPTSKFNLVPFLNPVCLLPCSLFHCFSSQLLCFFFLQIDQEHMEGPAGTGLIGHYVGASVTDEQGSAFKSPGVVARLMGLDYIPATCRHESHSAALRDWHCFSGDHSKKRTATLTDNPHHDIRSSKRPNSPIERFQVEMLPPSVAKTKPITHHKLLSPVRNPAFISPTNASYIIEEAARILNSELHCGTGGGVLPSKSPLSCSKEGDPHSIVAFPSNKSTCLESTVEITVAPLRVDASKRSLKVLKDSTSDQSVPSKIESHFPASKDGQNLVSVPIKAKTNLQKREGSSLKSRTIVCLDDERCSLKKPIKNMLNDRRNNQHKKGSGINNSTVLKQNNYKQSCLSGKRNLTLQTSASEQQRIENIPGDASFEKRKIGNKIPSNAKVGKKCAETDRFGSNVLPSSYKSVKQRKILVEHRSLSQGSFSSEEMALGRCGTLLEQNLVADKQSRWHDNNMQKATDVVSFTFTSPLRKPMAGSVYFKHKVESKDRKLDYLDKTYQINVCSDCENSSCSKLNATEDSRLGILIEKKLRELAAGAQSPYCKLIKGRRASYASVLDDSDSGFGERSVATPELKVDSVSLDSHQAEWNMSYRLQVVAGIEPHSSLHEDEDSDNQVLSPFSCHSIQSWENLLGNKIGNSLSFTQTNDMVDWFFTNEASLVAPELSDSPFPIFQKSNAAILSEISLGSHTNLCSQELHYVKEIITNTGFAFKDLIPCPVDHSFEILDPVLFDKLEETRTSIAFEGDNKELRLRRKILFDSVNECLDKKCSQYFRAGYRSWAKGVAVAAKELADHLYEEISGWRGIGEWMVDELVSQDMSTHLGGWINYEIEAFEATVDIEAGVFNSLVDEVAADFL